MFYAVSPNHFDRNNLNSDIARELKARIAGDFLRNNPEEIQAYWNLWKNHDRLAAQVFTDEQRYKLVQRATSSEAKFLFKHLDRNIPGLISPLSEKIFDEFTGPVDIKKLVRDKIKNLFINYPDKIEMFFALCQHTVIIIFEKNIFPELIAGNYFLFNFFSNEKSHKLIQKILKNNKITLKVAVNSMLLMEPYLDGEKFFIWLKQVKPAINEITVFFEEKMKNLNEVTHEEWGIINKILSLKYFNKIFSLNELNIVQLFNSNKLSPLSYRRLVEDEDSWRGLAKHYNAIAKESHDKKLKFMSKSPWVFGKILNIDIVKLLSEREYSECGEKIKDYFYKMFSSRESNPLDIYLFDDEELVKDILMLSDPETLRSLSLSYNGIIQGAIKNGYLAKIFSATFDKNQRSIIRLAVEYIKYVINPDNKMDEASKAYTIEHFRSRLPFEVLCKISMKYPKYFEIFYDEIDRFQHWLISSDGEAIDIECEKDIKNLIKIIDIKFDPAAEYYLLKTAIYFSNHDQIPERLDEFLNFKASYFEPSVADRIINYLQYDSSQVFFPYNNFIYDYEQLLKNLKLSSLFKIDGNRYLHFALKSRNADMAYKIFGTQNAIVSMAKDYNSSLSILETIMRAINDKKMTEVDKNQLRNRVMELSPYLYVNIENDKKTAYIAAMILGKDRFRLINIDSDESNKFFATFPIRKLNALLEKDKALRDELIKIFKQDKNEKEVYQEEFNKLMKYPAILPFLLYEHEFGQEKFLTDEQINILKKIEPISTNVQSTTSEEEITYRTSATVDMKNEDVESLVNKSVKSINKNLSDLISAATQTTPKIDTAREHSTIEKSVKKNPIPFWKQEENQTNSKSETQGSVQSSSSAMPLPPPPPPLYDIKANISKIFSAIEERKQLGTQRQKILDAQPKLDRLQQGKSLSEDITQELRKIRSQITGEEVAKKIENDRSAKVKIQKKDNIPVIFTQLKKTVSQKIENIPTKNSSEERIEEEKIFCSVLKPVTKSTLTKVTTPATPSTKQTTQINQEVKKLK